MKRVNFLTEYYEDMLLEEIERYKEVAKRYAPYMCGNAIDLLEDVFNMNVLPEKVQTICNVKSPG
jgi:hypothetical protein